MPRKKHKKDKRKYEEDVGNVCMCSALTKQSGYNRLLNELFCSVAIPLEVASHT